MCNATAKQRFISVGAKNGGICIVHKYSDLMTSNLGRSVEKMCNATAEQRFISVATKSGGICVEHNYVSDLMTNCLEETKASP